MATGVTAAQPALNHKPPKKLTNLERLERILKEIDTRKEEVRADIEKLKNLKYQPGDFVLHKTEGNCIVMDHYVAMDKYDLARDHGPSLPGAMNLPESVGYIVCGPSYHDVVLEKDLLPVNNTTKVLFNEKKG